MSVSPFLKVLDRVLRYIGPGYLSRSASIGRLNLSLREEWLKKVLLNIPTGSRILDVGAGELKYKEFCQHLKYTSQDFAQYDGSGDGKGLQMNKWDQTHLDIISDITSIPEPDGFYDAVMCIEVLEHVPNPLGALQEIERLIHSGGYLIVTAPFASLTHFSPYFYQTGFSKYFYEYWLEKYGFRILELNINGNYFEYVAQELHRLPSIAEHYSTPDLSWLEKKR
ncbi:MAG TPA: class I SAM-dependent methyltransferase [Anaerolineales bacterium]|nr:class I SAM-dependent methyltransferase [Anaerolineales bacterium]